MFVKNAWYTAAWSHEVADRPLARQLLGEPVVIFRDKAGKVGALLDACCHRGAPLSNGWVADMGLQCGYHGLVFDREGTCVHIPGQEKIPSKARVRSFPVVERDKIVWIWMGDPDRADASTIIDYPYHNDEKAWPHRFGQSHIAANYMLVVDNLMDLTHVGYVHGRTIGGSPSTHVQAKMDLKLSDTGVKFERWMLDSVPPPTYSRAYPFKGNVDRWQEFEFVAPSHILQYSGSKDVGGGAYEGHREDCLVVRLIHALTPETETSTHYFWSLALGFRQDEPEVIESFRKDLVDAFVEDKNVLEAQQSRLSALGEDGLVDIVSDRARIHMRRTIERLLAASASA